MSRPCWRQFVADCGNFLSSPEKWAERAARLGWDAMALFGCAPKRPLDYSGRAGLPGRLARDSPRRVRRGLDPNRVAGCP